MEKLLKEKLSPRFNPGEVEQIESFLDRGFSPNGVIVILSIFFCASDANKKLADVLPVCEQVWKNVWQFQHPDIKADGDAPGAAGLASRRAIVEIYEKLGIPSPAESVMSIPQKAFTVRTQNSVYRFEAIDKDGWRTVERLNKPMNLSRCKITFLALRKSMEMDYYEGGWWTTSPVFRIR